MSRKKVIVRGGMKNIYYVNEYSGKFFVTSSGGTDIGRAKSLDDALAIIKPDSGRDIEGIE